VLRRTPTERCSDLYPKTAQRSNELSGWTARHSVAGQTGKPWRILLGPLHGGQQMPLRH
jgi:hypothetical protein